MFHPSSIKAKEIRIITNYSASQNTIYKLFKCQRISTIYTLKIWPFR